MASFEGMNLAIFYYLSASKIWPGKSLGVTSLEGDNVVPVVFCYLGASEIWSDRMGGLLWKWPYTCKRGSTVLMCNKYTILVHCRSI